MFPRDFPYNFALTGPGCMACAAVNPRHNRTYAEGIDRNFVYDRLCGMCAQRLLGTFSRNQSLYVDVAPVSSDTLTMNVKAPYDRTVGTILFPRAELLAISCATALNIDRSSCASVVSVNKDPQAHETRLEYEHRYLHNFSARSRTRFVQNLQPAPATDNRIGLNRAYSHVYENEQEYYLAKEIAVGPILAFRTPVPFHDLFAESPCAPVGEAQLADCELYRINALHRSIINNTPHANEFIRELDGGICSDEATLLRRQINRQTFLEGMRPTYAHPLSPVSVLNLNVNLVCELLSFLDKIQATSGYDASLDAAAAGIWQLIVFLYAFFVRDNNTFVDFLRDLDKLLAENILGQKNHFTLSGQHEHYAMVDTISLRHKFQGTHNGTDVMNGLRARVRTKISKMIEGCLNNHTDDDDGLINMQRIERHACDPAEDAAGDADCTRNARNAHALIAMVSQSYGGTSMRGDPPHGIYCPPGASGRYDAPPHTFVVAAARMPFTHDMTSSIVHNEVVNLGPRTPTVACSRHGLVVHGNGSLCQVRREGALPLVVSNIRAPITQAC